MASEAYTFGKAVSSFDPDAQQAHRTSRKHAGNRNASRPPSRPTKSCFSRLIDLCAVRDRSEKELRERLVKDGYSGDEIEDALQRGTDCNFVNDARFADSFVRGKVSAGKGQRYIECELEKRGINPSILLGWPNEYGLCENDQLDKATSFLNTHPPRAKDVWGSAYRKLISKGYSSSIASQAVRTWFNQRESE